MSETTNASSGKLNELIFKTEKLTIDEKKYDTNWCDMPAEIKLELIGKMDFRMRCQFRLAARAEKKLVDSLKYKFDQLILDFNRLCLVNKTEEYDTRKQLKAYSLRRLSNEESMNLFLYAAKHCDVENVHIFNANFSRWFNSDKLDTLLKPKTVFWMAHPDNTMMQFFKICWNRVEEITIIASACDISFEQFFAIPSVYHAVRLHIGTYEGSQPTEFIPLIEKWIEIDAPVDTWFRFSSRRRELASLFDHFQNRMISREESTMLIKTDNPEKHIFMHLSEEGSPYLCVTVVPSDFDEVQYSEITSEDKV